MSTHSRERGPTQPDRRPRSWTWNDVNFLLDTALLVMFAALCFASVVMRFVFPPGPSAKGWTLWGLDYDAWGGVQFALLALLTGGILVHVMLHWSWVCTVLVSRFIGRGRQRIDEGMQTIYGVGLLIMLLGIVGGGIVAAVLTISGPA